MCLAVWVLGAFTAGILAAGEERTSLTTGGVQPPLPEAALPPPPPSADLDAAPIDAVPAEPLTGGETGVAPDRTRSDDGEPTGAPDGSSGNGTPGPGPTEGPGSGPPVTTPVTAPPVTGPPSPPPTVPPVGLARTDTGFTLVRFTLDSQAAWMTAELQGTEIRTIRVIEEAGGTSITSLGPVLALANPGTAVIEAVLAIAPGATPVLTICKNHLGPASVTVTRLTDGEAIVGQVANEGTDDSTASECANTASTVIDRADLIGPVRWPARVDPRPLVLANYYPWFGPAELSRDLGDNPLAGDTMSDQAVRAAVAQAAGSGIDGFVVEYETTDIYEQPIDLVFDAADDQGGFNVALMLDLEILYARHRSVSAAHLDQLLGAVASRAGHPSQLWVGDRPVAFVYSSHRASAAAWAAALQRLRDSYGVEPYLIDQTGHLGPSSLFAYHTNFEGNAAELADWTRNEVLEQRLQPALDGRPLALWVAPASPGYDDRRTGRIITRVVDRAGGARYELSWAAAAGSLPDWIMITSWNEYYEQTHVVPGDMYGSLALDQTAAFAAAFHANG